MAAAGARRSLVDVLRALQRGPAGSGAGADGLRPAGGRDEGDEDGDGDGDDDDVLADDADNDRAMLAEEEDDEDADTNEEAQSGVARRFDSRHREAGANGDRDEDDLVHDDDEDEDDDDDNDDEDVDDDDEDDADDDSFRETGSPARTSPRQGRKVKHWGSGKAQLRRRSQKSDTRAKKENKRPKKRAGMRVVTVRKRPKDGAQEDPKSGSQLGLLLESTLRQKDASPTDRVLAYTIAMTIGRGENLEARALWQDLLDILLDDLSHSFPDVRESALLALRAVPLAERIEAFATRQGIEYTLKACLADPQSAVRQVAVDVLGVSLMQLWMELHAAPWRLRELDGLHALSGAVLSTLMDTCKDRIVDIWRVIAAATTDPCDLVAGAAFQALADLVNPGGVHEGAPTGALSYWMLDDPASKSASIQELSESLRVLQRRVLDHLSAKIELVLLRVESMWPRSSVLTVAGTNPPASSSLFLPLAKTLQDPIFGIIPLGGDQVFPSSPEIGNGAFASANVPGFTRLGRSGSSLDEPRSPAVRESAATGHQVQQGADALEADADEGAEPTGYLGGASELAASAIDLMHGQASLICATALFQHLANPVKPPSFRAVSEDRLSRMVHGPAVAVEADPLADMTSFVEIPVSQIYRTWIENILRAWITSPLHPFATVCTAEHILCLARTCAAHVLGQNSSFQTRALQGVCDALCRTLKSLRSSSAVLQDRERARFHVRALHTLEQCCSGPQTILSVDSRARYLCFAVRECALSMSRTHFAFSDDFAGSADSASDARVDGLRALWRALLLLPMSADAFWAAVSAKEPGVLQEMLRENSKDGTVRRALCSSLFHLLLDGEQLEMGAARPTPWVLLVRLRALELLNLCLTWPAALGPFDAGADYLKLVDAVVVQVSGLSAASPQSAAACARIWALLQRMVDFNLDFGDFDVRDRKVHMLLVLCRCVSLLATRGDLIELSTEDAAEDPVRTVGESLVNALHLEFSDRLGASSICSGESQRTTKTLLDGAVLLGTRARALGPLVDEFMAMFEDGALAMEVKAARQRLRVASILPGSLFDSLQLASVSSLTHELEPGPGDGLFGATPARESDRWRVSALSRDAITFSQDLGGEWDPLTATLTCTPLPLRNEVMVRVDVHNGTTSAIEDEVTIALGCDGPCSVDHSKAQQRLSSPLASGSQCGTAYFKVQVASSRELRDELRTPPARRARDDAALDDAMADAVASRIASARKRASGKSFKAVIDKLDVESLADKPSTVGEKSSRRSSLTLPTRRLKRPSIIVPGKRGLFGSASNGLGGGAGSSNDFAGSSSSLGGGPGASNGGGGSGAGPRVRAPFLGARSASDMSTFSEENSRASVEAPSGNGNYNGPGGVVGASEVDEIERLGRGLDVQPRSLHVSLLWAGDGMLTFPGVHLPNSLLCQPISSSAGLSGTVAETNLPTRLGGWMRLERFQDYWNALSYEHSTRTSHDLPTDGALGPHSQLGVATEMVDAACKSLTRVAMAADLVPEQLSHCAFAGTTWGGAPFALFVNLSLTTPGEGSETICIAWDLRCASRDLHEALSESSVLDSFINAFAPEAASSRSPAF